MGIYTKLFAGVPAMRAVETAVPANVQGSRMAEAFQVLKAHVMIADQNNVIVSMNASVEKMLRQAEADIRKELPGFAVDGLIGANMDRFHRNPAHQHRILSNLVATHEAAVRIGGREFSLVATPLWQGGQRLGTVIEWQDLTETNALKRKELDQQQADKRRNDELQVITTALDSVSANVMMADNDGRIFFANKSVLRLLKIAEADIRTVLGGFSADALVGSNFDDFHRNASHQKNLLARLRQPYETDIAIGVRRFRLLASPVFGRDGQRLATVVEWQDRTAELRMEADVENVIKAAINGNLDVRLDHAAYAGFIGKMADGINQLLDGFDAVLKETGAALHALAQGNLRQKITGDYRGRYQALKTDINATVDRLLSVVTDIGSAAADVKSVSHELSMGNISLSQRTEQQAASLEETGAAMEEITRTVEQNTLSAATAKELSHEAKGAAEEGGKVLTTAIAAMEAISESSHRIDEIIGTIDGIAFQTNLLALNAAVEAARAGDHGRGFAVVAGEVRNLAGLSAKAAKEIKELIRDSGVRVREGAALVNRSGDTLSRIIHAVNKVNSVVDEIASSSRDQAKGVSEINKAVQEMDATTQQNAAMVEEASAASESLHQRAQRLNEMLDFFDTGSRRS